jgi:hypothetical protein
VTTGPYLRADRRGDKRSPDYSARYYALLPDARSIAAGDRKAAGEFVAALTELLNTALTPPWSSQERANLVRLLSRWTRRAGGHDPRWELIGARAGRLPRRLKEAP